MNYPVYLLPSPGMDGGREVHYLGNKFTIRNEHNFVESFRDIFCNRINRFIVSESSLFLSDFQNEFDLNLMRLFI